MNKIEQMKLELLKSNDSVKLNAIKENVDPRDQSKYSHLQGYSNGLHSQGGKIFNKQLKQAIKGELITYSYKYEGYLNGLFISQTVKSLDELNKACKNLTRVKKYCNGVRFF